MKNEPSGREQELLWEICAEVMAPGQATDPGELNVALVESRGKWTVLRNLEKLKSTRFGDGLTKSTRGEKLRGWPPGFRHGWLDSISATSWTVEPWEVGLESEILRWVLDVLDLKSLCVLQVELAVKYICSGTWLRASSVEGPVEAHTNNFWWHQSAWLNHHLTVAQVLAQRWPMFRLI